MNFANIWNFIAGDSRIVPVAIVLAIGAIASIRHYLPDAGPFTGIAFVAIISLGLIAGVFENTKTT